MDYKRSAPNNKDVRLEKPINPIVDNEPSVNTQLEIPGMSDVKTADISKSKDLTPVSNSASGRQGFGEYLDYAQEKSGTYSVNDDYGFDEVVDTEGHELEPG